jgi:hypothetical protein
MLNVFEIYLNRSIPDASHIQSQPRSFITTARQTTGFQPQFSSMKWQPTPCVPAFLLKKIPYPFPPHGKITRFS